MWNKLWSQKVAFFFYTVQIDVRMHMILMREMNNKAL